MVPLYKVYRGPLAAGNALWMGDWSRYEVSLRLDDRAAGEILAQLHLDGCSAQGVIPFGGMMSPLRWAEVVPTWFLRNLGAADGKPLRYVVLSAGCGGAESSHSADKAAVMDAVLVPENLRAGVALAEFAKRSEKRVFLLCSGDLSHRHGNGACPVKKTAGGGAGEEAQDDRFLNPRYQTADLDAEPFDAAMERWARNLDPNSLLQDAGAKLGTAHACGFDGCVLLQGCLARAAEVLEDAKVRTTALAPSRFHARVLARSHPVYFGMMVAVFTPAAAPSAKAKL